MSAVPFPLYPPRVSPEPPEYLPARRVNEFVYCPRLFFYEWVDGLFRDNEHTLEGSSQHKRVDARATDLPTASETAEKIHARSVELASERLRVIAKMDLVEAEGEFATPVDYKHGAPRENAEDGSLELWPTDRVQLALQAIVLRDNGYRTEEVVVFIRRPASESALL